MMSSATASLRHLLRLSARHRLLSLRTRRLLGASSCSTLGHSNHGSSDAGLVELNPPRDTPEEMHGTLRK
jgi:hypothetical protein